MDFSLFLTRENILLLCIFCSVWTCLAKNIFFQGSFSVAYLVYLLHARETAT